jgi:hypothetical protein
VSLVVFFSTEAGIVVVGDRAQTHATGEVGDAIDLGSAGKENVRRASKVFALGESTVFGVTGLPTINFVEKDTGKVIPAFSASNTIIRYGRTNAYDPDDPSFWGGLHEAVMKELMAKAPPGQAWVAPEDGFVFQSMFAHVPPDGSRWSYRRYRLTVFPKGGGTVTAPLEVIPHAMPGVHPVGNDLVYNEVVGGKDPRFEDVRNEAVVRRVIKPSRDEGKCSVPEAVAFAKRMCVVTQERRHLLETVDSGHNVSPETDGWLLKTAGWQRLHRDER